MMKKRIIILLSAAFVLGFTTTNNNRTLYLIDYYPVNKDISWKYSICENGEKYFQSVIMKSSKSKDDSFIIETEGKRKSVLDLFISDNVIYLKDAKVNWGPVPFFITVSNSTPIPVFNLKSREGFSWKWNGYLNYLFFNKEVEIDYEYLGFEETASKCGVYNCLKVRTIYMDKSERKELISWYAKGIGLIKESGKDYEKNLVQVKYLK